jgi:ribonucleoside-diphosphate reductase alpha chain
LGSINLSRIESLAEFRDVVNLATKFLICGTLVAKLPYEKVYKVRAKNRRLGLGLMGIHEWLVQRGYRYEVNDELRRWLTIYKSVSDQTSKAFSDSLGISAPVARRAIAPTGSIGILAGTTTGIEPIFAITYKRRYLKGTTWRFQYVVDGAAKDLIERYGVDPSKLESALDLATDFERRIRFQADIQDYVDMAISSTINLPRWNTELNNIDMVGNFAETLARYAHRLRGFTVYPDGSRGGQPLVSVPYEEAKDKLGEVFEENVQMLDVCEISGKGGSCGM